MELTQLVFKTETTELEKASQALGQLVKDFEKFDAASADAAKTQLARARTAKAEAEALLAKSKTAKTAIQTERETIALEKDKAKAIGETTRVVKANVDILQRQKDIANFQAEGFSKGQAGILATAKAAGQLSDELKRVLELQRTLMGTDPFDKSDLGVKSLSRALKEATESQNFFNQGMNLSIDQARTLSRDLDRMAVRGKSAGKSFDEITKAQAEYTKNYNDLASQYNRIDEAEKAIIKQRREVVSSTNYLVDADRKLAAALNVTNSQFDKAGTDLIVKYETALRKSGLAQDEVTRKLASYRTQLAAVQSQEKKRSEDNLARALSPQLTDIGVSLYSGQAPLTVLIQQGGQIADLFRLSGVEAQNFGKAMKDAFTSMIPVMATVAKGMGQFVLGSIVDMGKAMNGSIVSVIGMTGAVDRLYMKASEMGPSKAAANWRLFGTVVSAVTGGAIATAVTALIILGNQLSNIVKAQSELNKALVFSGARLGLTKKAAVEYAQSMKSAGVNTMQAMEALTEIAKTGKIPADAIGMVTKAAIEMQKYTGAAIDETVKQFAELSSESTKGLAEFAQKTGLVSIETIKLVDTLERQGNRADATRVAMQAMADAQSQGAEKIKKELSPLEQLYVDIKDGVKDVRQEIYELASSENFVGILRFAFESVKNEVIELTREIKGIFNLDPSSMLNFLGRLSPAGMMADLITGGKQPTSISVSGKVGQMTDEEISKYEKYYDVINVEGKKATRTIEEQRAAQAAFFLANEKAIDKSISKEEQYRRKKIEVENAVKDSITDSVEASKILAGWRKIIFGEGDKSGENYYENLIRRITKASVEATFAQDGLTKSQREMMVLAKDPKFLAMSKDRQNYVMTLLAENAAQEKKNEVDKLRNELLGQANGFSEDYFNVLTRIQELVKSGALGEVEAAQMTQALQDAQPYAKAMLDYYTKQQEAIDKNKADSTQIQASLAAQNKELDHRLSILGLSAEEQTRITIEYEKQKALAEALMNYEARKLAIENNKGFGDDNTRKAELDRAAKDYQDTIDTINRSSAVKYAEEVSKEFVRIRDSISDSIVTALFEGGKAGGKKLRDLIVNELKKPITVFINAVVSSIMGGSGTGSDMLSSLFGSGGGSGGGNFFSSLNNAVSSGFSNAFSSFATGPVGRSLGLSNAGAGTGGLDAGGYVGGSAYNPGAAGANGLTDLGKTLNNSIGMLGNALAGYGISRAISGGYQTGLGDAVDVLGAVASAFFGPIAGVISGLINRTFGRKLKDFGIEGTFGGESGFEGKQFQFYKGGLLRSDKTKYSPLEEASRKAIGDAFIAIRAQIGTFADALGLGTDKLKDFTTTMRVSTKGLSEESAQAKIMEAINTASNELAQQVLGTFTRTFVDAPEFDPNAMYIRGRLPGGMEDQGYTLDPDSGKYYKDEYTASTFAKEGETAIETLTRLATSLITVNALFDTLGYTLYEGSLAGADMASKLADLFGGLEKMTEQVNFYYQNFYSEGERQANLLRQLTKEFDKHNIKLPKTREEYRKLVEAQDLTTEEGRKMYQFLISLAPAFTEISQGAQESAANLKETLKSAAEEAFSVLERIVNAEIAKLNSQLTAQQDVVNRLQGIFDLLKNNVKDLYRQVDSTFKMQSAQGRAVIQGAIATGVIPDEGVLADAIGAVREDIESTKFSSKFESDKARLLLAAELLTLQDQVGTQLTIEEQVLQGIKDQIKYLEDLLATARKQLDAALGIDEGITSLDDALNRFLDSLNKLVDSNKPTPMPKPQGSDVGAFVAGGGSALSADNVPTRYQRISSNLTAGGLGVNAITDDSYTKRLDDLAVLTSSFEGTGDSTALFSAALGAGYTLQELADRFGFLYSDVYNAAVASGVPAFAGGGAHSGGLRLVGENSPELEITGPARYMNAPQMYDMMTQGASSGNDALRQEVSLLRTELRANVQHTAKLVKAIDRVTVGTNEGDALRTSTVV